MTGDCVWWAQQLAHADAATAGGLGGGGTVTGGTPRRSSARA